MRNRLAWSSTGCAAIGLRPSRTWPVNKKRRSGRPGGLPGGCPFRDSHAVEHVRAPLLPEQVRHDGAPMRIMPMLPEINPLPRPQAQAAATEGNHEVHSRQSRPHMGGHIIFAFFGVAKEPIAVWNEPREESFQVRAHFRIGIFLDEQ